MDKIRYKELMEFASPISIQTVWFLDYWYSDFKFVISSN